LGEIYSFAQKNILFRKPELYIPPGLTGLSFAQAKIKSIKSIEIVANFVPKLFSSENFTKMKNCQIIVSQIK